MVDYQGNVRKVPFSKEPFDYKSKRLEALVPDNLGFAGFWIHHRINPRDYQNEVCVFLGASYFRAVGRHMNYGLSARGLAIDTLLPGGEEFPYFRKFWLLQPTSDARDMTLYALLDSPGLTGAYRFRGLSRKRHGHGRQECSFSQEKGSTTRCCPDDEYVLLRRKRLHQADG